MQTHSDLLPLSLAASRLGIAARDLRLEAERGGIPFVRVGDHALLFSIEDVERILLARASGKQPMTEEASHGG